MAKEGVAAVERALSILDVFAENDQRLTLTEVSKRTGFYKSTTLRLAESLVKFGYLRRLEDGCFQLGPKPLFLGGLYQKHFRTADFVPKTLRQIVDRLHESASFWVRDGDRRVCLHRVDSPRAIRDSVREGDALPLLVGAAGQVILAFSGLTGEKYDEIREHLYSASLGERDPEAAAVACPVFGVDQRLAGVLSVSGPKYRFAAGAVGKAVPVIIKAARELTRAFGGDLLVYAKADASMSKRGDTPGETGEH
jgi:DNA-binding IclR family transcriptional regulator